MKFLLELERTSELGNPKRRLRIRYDCLEIRLSRQDRKDVSIHWKLCFTPVSAKGSTCKTPIALRNLPMSIYLFFFSFSRLYFEVGRLLYNIDAIRSASPLIWTVRQRRVLDASRHVSELVATRYLPVGEKRDGRRVSPLCETCDVEGFRRAYLLLVAS